MKRNTTAIIASLALFALMPMTAFADNGFFLGGSIGASTLDDDFDGLGVDTDSTSFRLTAGWQLNDFLSLEAGYHNFGIFEERLDIGGVMTDISMKADGFTLGATGNIPLGGKFSMFGRAGAFFWDGDAKINDISVATPEDTNLFYGAGADFKVSENFSLLGDWTRYELEDTHSDVISFGFKFRF